METPKGKDSKGKFIEGNDFWKFRDETGRKKLFATPQILLEVCLPYFKWVDENPLQIVEQSKSYQKPYKDEKGKVKIPKPIVKMPVARAYTLSGLAVYLGISQSYWRERRRLFKEKNDQESSDFLTVMSHIEEIIYQNQLEGAASGILNSNIIARVLGLKEHTQTDQNIKLDDDIDYSLLDDETLRKITEAKRK